MITHWHAPIKPATTSVDLRIEAVVAPGVLWRRRLSCAGETPAPEAIGDCLNSRVNENGTVPFDLPLAPPERPTCCRPLSFVFPSVRTISIPIVRPTVQVQSFAFPDVSPLPTNVRSAPGEEQGVRAGDLGKRDALTLALSQEEREPMDLASADSRTRIKPPADGIKLADRLQYVLQPSLESLLAEGSLAFPFRPFPFQFEGVAFLYPRKAAILADEMGLGKTMQAITAIRLLLRRGQVQSVLLV